MTIYHTTTRRKTFFIFCFSLLFSSPPHLLAQGLFDQAVESTSDSPASLSFELNGFIRGVLFGGTVPDLNNIEFKSGYGETALKLRVRKGDFGDVYAEFRIRRGFEFGETVSELRLRESYVNLYAGVFDFRIGHQIIVWGRADGFNPTNNITPQNMLIRSSDEDDKREGNFIMQASVNILPFRFEALWIPVYAASVLPTQLIPLPPGVELDEMILPSPEFKNGAAAFRLDLELPSFDGSVSFFHGFGLWPGITASFDALPVRVRPEPYRMTVVGGDFSTTLGSWGLRGEAAYKDPEAKQPEDFHIPNAELQWVLGLDRSWGDLTCVVQYIGKWVRSFTPLSEPSDYDPLFEIKQKNRLIASQLHERAHAVSFRPAISLFHENTTFEIAGMVNFTTEEMLLRPKWSSDLTDAFTLIIGAEWYSGPDGTLYGTIDEALSSVFVELRAAF